MACGFESRLPYISRINKMKNLAETIFRQRLIMEGLIEKNIPPSLMVEYLEDLSDELDMVPLTAPACSYHADHGWCSHMHWITSGVHMYTWEHHKPIFFTVDVYTCKPFDDSVAVSFTKNFFKSKGLIALVHKSM